MIHHAMQIDNKIYQTISRVFQAKKNKRVRIKFFDLDIEDDAQCQYDRLTLQLGNERLPLT